MATLIKCPNSDCKHHFPVNPKKHLYRRERYCPRCKTPVKVRGRLGNFLPNPNWSKEKDEAAGRVAELRRIAHKHKHQQDLPAIAQVPLVNMLYESLQALKQIQQEKTKKEVKK